MKQATRAIRWVAINGSLAYLAWIGVNGNGGAGNATIFLTWFRLIVYGLSLAVEMDDEMRERLSSRSVPAAVDGAFDLLLASLFVWHGWWLTAIAFMLAVACRAALRSKAQAALTKEAA